MAATKATVAPKKQAKAAGVKVTVKQNYYDLQLKTIKHAGESFEVEATRAAELKSLNLVEY